MGLYPESLGINARWNRRGFGAARDNCPSGHTSLAETPRSVPRSALCVTLMAHSAK